MNEFRIIALTFFNIQGPRMRQMCIESVWNLEAMSGAKTAELRGHNYSSILTPPPWSSLPSNSTCIDAIEGQARGIGEKCKSNLRMDENSG